MSAIRDNVRRILAELPPGVELAAAAKTRTPEEILEAIEAGIAVIGENYVQEGQAARAAVGSRCTWSLIGHLQTNKAKKAVEVFDMVETVDSLDLARELDKRCTAADKILPVLIEINSGEEGQKAGIQPAEAETLLRAVAALPRLRIRGLMTMGPYEGDPEDSRPYFRTTHALFERFAALGLPGVEMSVLSMGMSHSYRVALQEGATRVRLGTAIFGPRL